MTAFSVSKVDYELSFYYSHLVSDAGCHLPYGNVDRAVCNVDRQDPGFVLVLLLPRGLKVAQGQLAVRDLVWVIWPVQVDGFDLRVELHEDGLHTVGHGVARVVEVVEVLAKGPVVRIIS